MLFEVKYFRNPHSLKINTKYIEVSGEWNQAVLTNKVLQKAKLKHPMYVYPVLKEVDIEEAKNDYCHDIAIFIKNNANHQLHCLTPSWDYSSHASSESLFYRSLENICGHNRPSILYSNKL